MIIKDRALTIKIWSQTHSFFQSVFFLQELWRSWPGNRLSTFGPLWERKKGCWDVEHLNNEQHSLIRSKVVLTYSSVALSFVDRREDDASKELKYVNTARMLCLSITIPVLDLWEEDFSERQRRQGPSATWHPNTVVSWTPRLLHNFFPWDELVTLP